MYEIFYKANNKGADQTAQMRRLVCTCVDCHSPKTGFLTSGPILLETSAFSENNTSCYLIFTLLIILRACV